jgi:hypothetical protein
MQCADSSFCRFLLYRFVPRAVANPRDPEVTLVHGDPLGRRAKPVHKDRLACRGHQVPLVRRGCLLKLESHA